MKETDGKIYFSPDGVHPYLNTGHVLYTQTLIRCLEQMEKMKGKEAVHHLDEAFDENNFEKSSSIDISKQVRTGSWRMGNMSDEHLKPFSNYLDHVWCAEPGASISFSFKGESLVSYDIIGPEGCALDVTVDGKTHRVNRFDGYCTYWRIHSYVLASGLEKDKVHQVTIKITDENLDKKVILFERNRGDFMNNPNKYKPVVWYLNQIFTL